MTSFFADYFFLDSSFCLSRVGFSAYLACVFTLSKALFWTVEGFMCLENLTGGGLLGSSSSKSSTMILLLCLIYPKDSLSFEATPSFLNP